MAIGWRGLFLWVEVYGIWGGLLRVEVEWVMVVKSGGFVGGGRREDLWFIRIQKGGGFISALGFGWKFMFVKGVNDEGEGEVRVDM